MTKRRMFNPQVIDTDDFMDMPSSTQMLYFHLAMRADDDGFIDNPKRIMRMTGASDDDFKILITKKYIIPFETGICVIRHWRLHNYIQKDRYTETEYLDEKKQLSLNYGKYESMDTKWIQNGSKMDTKCIQNGYIEKEKKENEKKEKNQKKEKENKKKENINTSHNTEDNEKTPPNPSTTPSSNEEAISNIQTVVDYYKNKINSRVRVTSVARNNISSCLKRFSVSELKEAVDKKKNDDFFMKNNAKRGISWFFSNKSRLARYLEEDTHSNDGRMKI